MAPKRRQTASSPQLLDMAQHLANVGYTAEAKALAASSRALQEDGNFLRALEHGAPTAGRRSQLMHAAFRGDKERVALLLRHFRGVPAYLGARDPAGRTALAWAARAGAAGVVALLVGAGADVRARDASHFTPLRLAVLSGNHGGNVIGMLVAAGADVNEHPVWLPTLLMYALSLIGSAAAVRQLLAAGADVDARDSEGGTALMRASATGAEAPLLRSLLEAGADVNAHDRFGETALMRAAESLCVTGVSVLLAAGADKAAVDAWGRTARDKVPEESRRNWASQNERRADVVRMLGR